MDDPLGDSNVPFAEHNLRLNSQTKRNPPKEQRVPKLHATHSTSQLHNNRTRKEENKRGRQPEHDAELRRRWLRHGGGRRAARAQPRACGPPCPRAAGKPLQAPWSYPP